MRAPEHGQRPLGLNFPSPLRKEGPGLRSCLLAHMWGIRGREAYKLAVSKHFFLVFFFLTVCRERL